MPEINNLNYVRELSPLCNAHSISFLIKFQSILIKVKSLLTIIHIHTNILRICLYANMKRKVKIIDRYTTCHHNSFFFNIPLLAAHKPFWNAQYFFVSSSFSCFFFYLYFLLSLTFSFFLTFFFCFCTRVT